MSSSSEQILFLHSYSSISNNQQLQQEANKTHHLIRKVTSLNQSPAIVSNQIFFSQNINLFNCIAKKMKENLKYGFQQIQSHGESLRLENLQVSVKLQKQSLNLLKKKKNTESLQLDPFNSNYFKPSKVMKGHHSKNSSNNSDKLKEIVQQIYQGKEIEKHCYRNPMDKQSQQSQKMSSDQISIKLLKFDNFLKGGKQSSLLFQQFMDSSQDSKVILNGKKKFGSESLYENHLVYQRSTTVQNAVNEYLKTNKLKLSIHKKKAIDNLEQSNQQKKLKRSYSFQKNINRRIYELLIVVFTFVVFGVLLFKYFQGKNERFL